MSTCFYFNQTQLHYKTHQQGHWWYQALEIRHVYTATVAENRLWFPMFSDESGFPSVAKEHCAMLRHDNPDNNAAAHVAEGGLKTFRMKVIVH